MNKLEELKNCTFIQKALENLAKNKEVPTEQQLLDEIKKCYESEQSLLAELIVNETEKSNIIRETIKKDVYNKCRKTA